MSTARWIAAFVIALVALGGAPAAHAAVIFDGGLISQNSPDNSCREGCGGWFNWGTGANGLPCQNRFARSFWIRGTDPTGPILNPHRVNSGFCDQTTVPLSVTLEPGVHDFTILFGTGYPIGPGPWVPVTVDVSFPVPGSTTARVNLHVGMQEIGSVLPDGTVVVFGGSPSDTKAVGNAVVTLSHLEWLGIPPLPKPDVPSIGVDRVAGCCSQPDGLADGIARVRITVEIPDGPPTSIAGGPYSVTQDEPVMLDGRASFDDNTPSAELGYAWTLTGTPAGSDGGVLSGASTATPTFTPDVPGDFRITLTVTDAAGQSASAVATVSSGNVVPVAHAGPSLGTYVGASVTLDGSLSFDPNGDAITYGWTLAGPGGSAATLASPDSAAPSFSPDVIGQYTATLTVTDEWGDSASASVTISVATPGNYAEEQATTAVNSVNALPPTSVTSPGNQAALANFLHQTTNALQTSNTAVAIAKLENAIARTDGCVLRGAPDGNGPGRDWVTDCAAQQQLYDDLNAALQALQP